MRVNLTVDEAQALLDGINAVIRERIREVALWTEHLDPSPERDRVVEDLRQQLETAKSARRKLYTR